MNLSDFYGILDSFRHYFDLEALVGGLLIGLAGALLYAANGRIAGISGIVGKLFGSLVPFPKHLKETVSAGEWFWRLFFLLGLFSGGVLLETVMTEYRSTPGNTPLVATVIAGLLVGYGTRMGFGCTSGHGVCGIGRFSLRSVFSTVIFIASGMLVTAIIRLAGGL